MQRQGRDRGQQLLPATAVGCSCRLQAIEAARGYLQAAAAAYRLQRQATATSYCSSGRLLPM
jgi:hypothetical protein